MFIAAAALAFLSALPQHRNPANHGQPQGAKFSFRATTGDTDEASRGASSAGVGGGGSTNQAPQQPVTSPIPVMPSRLFQQLAESQLELLASSLIYTDRTGASSSKIKSMALYLPQENVKTGQLEFSPAILYPHPTSERVFIASDAETGMAPALPTTLTKLPGFAHATSLLPAYPMVSMNGSSDVAAAGIGVVEEVLCNLPQGGAALSVPLFSGSQTVGVLLVSPSKVPKSDGESAWTEEDRQQVARAAKSLSLALSMDSERSALQEQNERVRESLSDNLHQFKNPLQALRTYGKLLQRRIADAENGPYGGAAPQLLELAEHLMVQSDRLVEKLRPVDAIVESMERGPFMLRPVPEPEEKALVRWAAPLLPLEEEDPGLRATNRAVEGSKRLDLSSMSSRKTLMNLKDEPAASAASSLLSNMELEMSFVPDVLEPVVSAFRAIALDRGISFVVDEVDELPGVTISSQALQETVSNLLDNSFKYVVLPKPGDTLFSKNPRPQVRVRLFPNKRPVAPGVTILVEDNGPGIPLRDREAVFERGVRTKATENVNGTGIGLDIARTLAQRMGGTLRVADRHAIPDSLDGTTMELVLFRQVPS